MGMSIIVSPTVLLDRCEELEDALKRLIHHEVCRIERAKEPYYCSELENAIYVLTKLWKIRGINADDFEFPTWFEIARKRLKFN